MPLEQEAVQVSVAMTAKTCSQKKKKKNLLQTVNAAGDDSVSICPPKELTKLIMGFPHPPELG